MKKILSILTISFVFFGVSLGQTDEAYARTLKKMFTVSGTEESYQGAIKQMFDLMKQQSPDVESSIWEDFEKEFSNTSMNELVDMFQPVYQKYLSLEDLEEMIKFYETPIGRKYAKSTPFIMQESMLIGQQWGMKLGQEMAEKLKEKGY